VRHLRRSLIPQPEDDGLAVAYPTVSSGD